MCAVTYLNSFLVSRNGSIAVILLFTLYNLNCSDFHNNNEKFHTRDPQYTQISSRILVLAYTTTLLREQACYHTS